MSLTPYYLRTTKFDKTNTSKQRVVIFCLCPLRPLPTKVGSRSRYHVDLPTSESFIDIIVVIRRRDPKEDLCMIYTRDGRFHSHLIRQ